MKQLLMNIGLNENETKLYLALLKIGKGTIAECVKISGLPRSSSYSAIKALIDRGVIAEISGKPARFCCLPPKEAFQKYMDARTNEIDRLYREKLEKIEDEHKNEMKHIKEISPLYIDELIKQAEVIYDEEALSIDIDRDVMLLRGEKVAKKFLDQFIVKKEAKCISTLPILFDERQNPAFRKEIVKQLLKFGIKQKVIIETGMLDIPYLVEAFRIDIEAVSFKHLADPTIRKLMIMDNSIAFVGVRHNASPEEYISILVKNRELIKFLSYGFDTLWNKAKPVTIELLDEKLEKIKSAGEQT